MAPNNCNKKFHADIETTDNVLIFDTTYDLSALPEEVLRNIFKFLKFNTLANIRLVCQKFDVVCKSMLNLKYKKLHDEVNKRYELALQMPRQVPLSCKRQVIIYLSEELYKLQRLLGKHMNEGCCCFFAGNILDEIDTVLRIVDSIQDKQEYVIGIDSLPKTFKILNKYLILQRRLVGFLKSNKHFKSQKGHYY